jgi:hypothetical protein
MGFVGYLFTPSCINKHIHSNKNPKKMKKVFAILAVVAFVACNSGENKEATGDTSVPAVTETPSGDTSSAVSGDTSKAAGDTSKQGN